MTNVHARVFSIGRLAKAASVTAPTIRYYEEIGLLPKARRTSAGQRIYAYDELERLIFIRRCREFGFSIDEVRVLASLSISPVLDCSEVRDLARTHLSEVRARLEELNALEVSLASFASKCDAACAGGPAQDCVVFDDLRSESGCR